MILSAGTAKIAEWKAGMRKPKVAIVNYHMGNLFSVKHACQNSELDAVITSSKHEIGDADAVILPGVGAFGDAMVTLGQLDLVDILKDIAGSGKPFIGICLGMHLLMTEGFEFGRHKGLGILNGSVVRFDKPIDESGVELKVPHVGWNKIYKKKAVAGDNSIGNLLLENIEDGEFMYFVHSYYVQPESENICLTRSRYGTFEFCSSIQKQNICALQFHPERSGHKGLNIYRKLAEVLNSRIKKK